MGKDKKKPRGAMTPYACFVKVIRAEHKKKHPDEKVVFSEFSKKCAEKWSQMLDKEKKRFQDMSGKDKERYHDEMKTYVPTEGSSPMKGKKGRRTKKMKKDPNAPKRSLSGFMWFCKDERQKVKEVHPELKMGQIAKILSTKWRDCQNRPYYEGQAEVDKKRYAEQMRAYRAHKGNSKVMIPVNEIVPTTNTPKLPQVASESESDESGSDDDDDEDSDE